MSRRWLDRLAGVVLSGFGSGNFKPCPGTAGSLVVVVVVLLLPRFDVVLAVLVFSMLAGFLLVGQAERLFGSSDPARVVIDEWAGMALALLWIPLTVLPILIAFGWFRFYDAVKPFGVRRLDQMKHPASIMWDDLLAGVYANLSTCATLWIAGKCLQFV